MVQDLKQRREQFVALFNRAPIKKAFGMEISYDADGNACFELPYNENFDHALNGVHGGVFATLLDNAGWFTVAPHYDTWIATVEFQVRLLEHVKQEKLISTGKLVRLGKRIATAEMQVHTASGRLVATGAGTFAPTTVPIAPEFDRS